MKSNIESASWTQVVRIAAVLGLGLGLGAVTFACVSCNTAEGVGEDVEAAGEGIQDIAKDTKDAITD